MRSYKGFIELYTSNNVEYNYSIFFNIQISLLPIANLSYKCSLKLSFSCSLSPECFWVFTFSTTRFLMYESGCSEESDFLEKITS